MARLIDGLQLKENDGGTIFWPLIAGKEQLARRR